MYLHDPRISREGPFTSIRHINFILIYASVDSGSTQSFVLRSLIAKLQMQPCSIDSPDCTTYHKSLGRRTQNQPATLKKPSPDTISHPRNRPDNTPDQPFQFGMDWLTKYRAQIQCTTKTVQISHPPETTLQFRKPSCKLISASKARKLKVHLYQLVDVTITSENKHDLSSVPVVSEYLGHSTWLRSWIRNKS